MIVTPNSMVRMIVSATTDGEQAVASGTGSLGVVVVAGVGTRIVTRRGPTSAHRHDNIPGNPPITDALSFTKSRFTFRADRPFHPQRLNSVLDEMRGLLRSKGFCFERRVDRVEAFGHVPIQFGEFIVRHIYSQLYCK
ncbi:CobW C-terminal domain-containing protein [Mycobacterium kiyosense]